MTRYAFIPVVAAIALIVAIAARGQRSDWCPAFAASVQLSDYVDQHTGRLNLDPASGQLYSPDGSRVIFTRREVDCIRRQAQGAVDAYEGGRNRPVNP